MLSVLIVDDYEFSRRELRTMDVWGDRSGFYIAAEARNGREALQILRRRPVDLVITDIRMPVVDGITLTESVLSEKLCPCIILVSQFDSFEYARMGIRRGAFEYLLKPLTRESVLESLRRASHFIGERALELMKINYAEQAMKTQAVDCYPYEELEALKDSIIGGGEDSADAASKLIDRLWALTGNDLHKTGYYLNRILQELDGAVRKEFTWLGKLTKTAPGLIDFTELGTLEAMCSAFHDYIGTILSTLTRYRLAAVENSIVRTACSYILENVDAPMSLNALSKKLYISNSYLSLLFKQKTGINLNSYITFVKMERSRILLEEGQLRSYEIAEKIGFSIEYFSKIFKKTYTISPMEYRKTL
jgi:two-component system response regulator YesN